MTLASRSLSGIVFAALLARSIVATTQNAIAKSAAPTSTYALPTLFDDDFLPAFFDRDFVEHAKRHLPRPLGRLGVTWE